MSTYAAVQVMSTYAAVRPKRPTATEVQRAESVGQLSGIEGLKS